MDTLTQLADNLQTVFTSEADALGRSTGFVQRASKCNGSRFAQTVVFGYLTKPDSSFEELCQTGLRAGLEITPQGLEERFGERAARFLKALLERAVQHLVQGDTVLQPVLQRFSQVRVLDSSTISLPASLKKVWQGCGVGHAAKEGRVETNAALKVHLELDLCRGGIVGLELGAAKQNDRQAALAQATPPAGSLSLRDLGYFNLAQLNQQERYSLTRFKAGTKLVDTQGHSWEMSAWLAQKEGSRLDEWVVLGQKERVRVRLIAARVPAKVAQARRTKLRQEAQRAGRTVSAERLALAGWQIYVTNVPQALLSLMEALSLGRARWQIELVFKWWKSQGEIDQWSSEKPWTILCQVYAKLLAGLIKQWVVASSSWVYPERSMVKAGQVVMAAGRELVGALNQSARLWEVLKIIERGMVKGCKLNQRKTKPNNYQILLDPNLGYYELLSDNNSAFTDTMLA